MKKLTTKERIIKYLLSLDREHVSNQLQVTVSKNKLSGSEIEDIEIPELISILTILETEGYITTKFMSPKRDLSVYVPIVLHDTILNYFENKHSVTVENRNKWIQFWIPVTISIVALAVSIIALA